MERFDKAGLPRLEEVRPPGVSRDSARPARDEPLCGAGRRRAPNGVSTWREASRAERVSSRSAIPPLVRILAVFLWPTVPWVDDDGPGACRPASDGGPARS